MKLFSLNNRSDLMLLFLLPGLYLSDILYGYLYHYGFEMPVSPGQVIRGGFFFFSFLIIFLRPALKLPLYYYILFSIIWVGFSSAIGGSLPQSLMYDISAASKLLYTFFAIFFFYNWFSKNPVCANDILRYIEIVFYMLGISLLLMWLFNIGVHTYGPHSVDFKGVFRAQNDIGLSIAIAMAAACYKLIISPGIVRVLFFVFAMIGFSNLGTRTSMAALIVIPAMVILVMMYGHSNYWRGFRKTVLILSIVPIVTLAGGIIGSIAIDRAMGSHYQQAKLDRIAKGEVFRDILLDVGLMYIRERSAVKDFFGEGALSYRRGVYEHSPEVRADEIRAVEMDWFDLYGQYGLIFVISVYIYYLYYLLHCMHIFFRGKDPIYGIFTIMLGTYLGHSVVAGHALMSPIVGTLIAAVIGFVISQKTYYLQHFDCRGPLVS